MTDCASRFSLVALALLLVAVSAHAQSERPRPSREAAATLVVFNTRDPESRALADCYAERRYIPYEQVIGLDCPTEEEITRDQFSDTIETPLKKLFDRKGWWEIRKGFEDQTEVTGSRIRYVALMRGMPLKIKTTIVPPAPDKPAPPRPNGGDPIGGHDEASVDSELSVLGAFRTDHFGIVNNPYFRRFAPILDSAVTSGLLLVCRLDAPAADTVRRMIDDSLEAERNGLYGWAYIDRRSIPESGYKDGDEWLQNAATECWNEGIPVILDNMPPVFPLGFPVTDAALYYGWYEWGFGGGLATVEKPFRRGAVAVHIQSFSARTLRDPNAHWVGPLVTRGAAATMGNVYEPYLDLTPHLDIFNERLLKGFTLAE
ncbi:MAG: TIGR03790 family protein, partial [Chthoniobacterales bacterium]